MPWRWCPQRAKQAMLRSTLGNPWKSLGNPVPSQSADNVEKQRSELIQRTNSWTTDACGRWPNNTSIKKALCPSSGVNTTDPINTAGPTIQCLDLAPATRLPRASTMASPTRTPLERGAHDRDQGLAQTSLHVHDGVSLTNLPSAVRWRTQAGWWQVRDHPFWGKA